MDSLPVSQRLGLRLFGTVRALVVCFFALLLLLLVGVVVLRLYGIPDPLLREVVRRVNAAGIPADVGAIRLTLRGWRAEDVRYYSDNPDDMEPLFWVKELYFDRLEPDRSSASEGWKLELDAREIRLSPALHWGIEMPPESTCRAMESLKGVVVFAPKSIAVENAEIVWLGIRFGIDGKIAKAPATRTTPPRQPSAAKTTPPIWLDAGKCRALERRLSQLSVAGKAAVDCTFSLDLGDPMKNKAHFSAVMESVSVRGVRFPQIELVGSYTHPAVGIERMSADLEGQRMALRGNYDFATGLTELHCSNGIESPRLLQLLPDAIQQILSDIELDFEQLPLIELSAGPSPFHQLHNHLDGTVSLRNTTFRGLEIERLKSGVRRSDGVLEFYGMDGCVKGQEWRAEETGSSMLGGCATGRVFWDAKDNRFGVDAEGAFDPLLLLRPLDMVEEATNVIARFRFPGPAPHVAISLGADMDDWKTFFIDVTAQTREAVVHEAAFTAVELTARYTNSVLRLDPVMAQQGEAFVKGWATLDFHNEDASFDAETSLHPRDIEGLVYPGLNLFGEKIDTEGDVLIHARGLVDWDTMAASDFTAEVRAQRVNTPMAGLDHFSARVSSVGPLLKLEEVTFNLYGGRGTGRMGVELNPAEPGYPYDMQMDLTGIDFLSCLRYLAPTNEFKVAGTLDARFGFDADFSRSFFDCANGTGTVAIVNGQLADLPLFREFSRQMRRLIPGFNVFSITSLSGSVVFDNGVIRSDDVYFGGDLISASGRGSYTYGPGFDAYLQVRAFSDNTFSRVVRAITDPIFKFLEIRLAGTLATPTWRLDKMPEGMGGFFRSKTE